MAATWAGQAWADTHLRSGLCIQCTTTTDVTASVETSPGIVRVCCRVHQALRSFDTNGVVLGMQVVSLHFLEGVRFVQSWEAPHTKRGSLHTVHILSTLISRP